jgi:hypothetical protein
MVNGKAESANVCVVTPPYGALLERLAHVPVLFSCHWYVKLFPVALTDMDVVPFSQTVTGDGCVKITGNALTDKVASLVILLEHDPNVVSTHLYL